MEPVSAIVAVGLACNVAQLLKLSWKLVSKSRTIEAQGRSPEKREAKTVTADLQEVNATLLLYLDRSQSGNTNREDQALRELCKASSEIAVELLQHLVRIQNVGGTHKSFRKALKVAYRRDELNNLSVRLQEYRTQLNTRLLLSLRGRVDTL